VAKFRQADFQAAGGIAAMVLTDDGRDDFTQQHRTRNNGVAWEMALR
jgi:hypothetical protein